jgi:hypothetical protein
MKSVSEVILTPFAGVVDDVGVGGDEDLRSRAVR